MLCKTVLDLRRWRRQIRTPPFPFPGSRLPMGRASINRDVLCYGDHGRIRVHKMHTEQRVWRVISTMIWVSSPSVFHSTHLPYCVVYGRSQGMDLGAANSMRIPVISRRFSVQSATQFMRRIVNLHLHIKPRLRPVALQRSSETGCSQWQCDGTCMRGVCVWVCRTS